MKKLTKKENEIKERMFDLFKEHMDKWYFWWQQEEKASDEDDKKRYQDAALIYNAKAYDVVDTYVRCVLEDDCYYEERSRWFEEWLKNIK